VTIEKTSKTGAGEGRWLRNFRTKVSPIRRTKQPIPPRLAQIALLTQQRDEARSAWRSEREGRLRAEEALGQRQNLLQAIIDYAPQAITVQDLVEGRHLLANRRQAASLAGLAFTRLTEAIPARRT